MSENSRPLNQSQSPRLKRGKKRKSKPERWIPLLGFLILGGAYGFGSLWWRSQIRPVQAQPTNGSEQMIVVTIPPGTSANGVGEILTEQKLIHSPMAWNLWTRWAGVTNRAGGFQAGTYQLSPSGSMTDLAEMIWAGKVQEDSFTIPEGWNISQMARYFEQQEWFTADEFLAAVDAALEAPPPWFPSSVGSLEGFLFPDTYQIPVDAKTPEGVIASMLSRFEQTALPLYEKYGAGTDFNLQEWVTLASIIEKEAVVDEERPLISGVFVNRLEQGIPLGSDPTVEYGLGITQTPEQPLTYKQVETPSPYNTYQNVGLTPTPIAAPGYASLEVTLRPAETEYLYFVARYDGTHVFSKTLGEHERAQGQIRDKIDAQE
jgi:UPF0755 protein